MCGPHLLRPNTSLCLSPLQILKEQLYTILKAGGNALVVSELQTKIITFQSMVMQACDSSHFGAEAEETQV